jgi:hypothetical protein
VFAAVRHWDAVVPIPALLLATGSALAVGAAAGIYPALRAARLSPPRACGQCDQPRTSKRSSTVMRGVGRTR